MKHISIASLPSRSKENCHMLTVKVDPKILELIYRDFPDLKNSVPLNGLLANPNIKYILVAIYEDKNGQSKRRIAAAGKYKPGDEKDALKEIAGSLGIDVERMLESKL